MENWLFGDDKRFTDTDSCYNSAFPRRNQSITSFANLSSKGKLRSEQVCGLDFDPANLPESFLVSLEETMACHANRCFVAAAIMVRKTLEKLCRDRQAKGNSLKERIRSLGTKVVLPQDLLDGLDDLRLLGNGAARIESQEFNKIGQEEVAIGIEFAKEVLKAAYQYSALLTRLRALKKAPMNP